MNKPTELDGWQKELYITTQVILGKTYKEVGEIFSLSDDRIRQISTKTIRKLARFKQGRGGTVPAEYYNDVKAVRAHQTYWLARVNEMASYLISVS